MELLAKNAHTRKGELIVPMFIEKKHSFEIWTFEGVSFARMFYLRISVSTGNISSDYLC